MKTDYTKCLSCRWRDVNNAQCFDGHLQYNGKLECEGFEVPSNTNQCKTDYLFEKVKEYKYQVNALRPLIDAPLYWNAGLRDILPILP